MKQDVPVVVIGLGRGRGISDIPPIFENTPYYVAACMDLTEVDEEYRYSPHNLGVILHNLHPRPRALLIGIAVDPSYTQPVERVWNEYVEKVLKIEKNDSRGWQENVCVSLPRTHFVDPKKPETWSEVRSTWQKEMFRQLDGAFLPK
ncbi:hypothetical protein CSIM01_05527 [Colletotrichum simmondsii]|uniref:Uncharacterized protein n=1 Tax=Colletotrichum simmondsii TaxID=703756 RepID=A0A135S1H1_9PEZI|nr:hypothetical protein CSIM01_05527 [Colletotrichum simmondsii]